MSVSPIAHHPAPPTDSNRFEHAGAQASAPRPAARRGDVIEERGSAARPTLRDVAHARRAALVVELLTRVPTADRAAAKTAIPAILEAAQKSGTTDPNRIGYLLATAQTESDFGANMTESGHSKEWFNANYGGDDGNRPGTSDGYAYRGRGYVQTTHAGRYAELSRRLGLPDVPALERGRPCLDAHGKTKMQPALVAHPEKLAEPKLAARALVIGVQENLFTRNARAGLETTIPAGRKPGDVDFYHARGLVNGIVKSEAETIAHRATTYAQILDNYRHSVLGVAAAK